MFEFTVPDTPILFFILAFWMGMAVLIGVFIWLRDIKIGRYDGKSLRETVIISLLRGLTLSILTSITLAVAGWRPLDMHHFWPEWLLLAIFIVYFSLSVTKGVKDKTRVWQSALLLETFHITFMAIIALMVWILTLLLGIAVLQASVMIASSGAGAFFPLNPLRDAVLVVGFLWLTPYIYLYNAANRLGAKKEISLPEHFRFHHILWPVLLALLLFMIPLFIESALHSEKYKDMQKPTQILRMI